jgi:hypothetical protein
VNAEPLSVTAFGPQLQANLFVPFAVPHLSRRGIAQSATTLRFSEFNRSCFCAVGGRLDVFSQAAAA